MSQPESDDLQGLTPEQQQEVQQGRLFLHHFFSILRGALYHSSNNAALEEPSEHFAKQLEWVLAYEGERVTFVAGGGQIFLGSMRVRPHSRQQKVVEDLQKFLDRRGIGGLTFQAKMSVEQVRTLAQLLVKFTRPDPNQDAVALLSREFEQVKLSALVTPMPAVRAKISEGTGSLEFRTELGQIVQQFAKGYGVLSSGEIAQTPAGRGVIRNMARQLAELHGEQLDAMVGLSMLAAVSDYPMRSLTIVVVSLAIADQFGATKEILSELGQMGAELAWWDEGIPELAPRYGRAMAGAVAVDGLNRIKRWPLATLRRYLTLGSRYLPPEGQPSPDGAPPSIRAAELMRAASDYVDLVTPTPLAKTEPLFQDAPMAPHEALLNMQDQIGARFSAEVFSGLVRGVGLLPVGTPVVTGDGAGSVIVRRTTDPFTFLARDAQTLREREVALMPGRNQIHHVVVGAELLDVRTRCILGDDHQTLLNYSREVRERYA